jgi:hypothetical protein
MESIIINNQSYQIDDEYFVKNLKKSVSFSDDCKTHDDASHYNNLFALLCKNFFRCHNIEERISNSFGVLNFLANSDNIDDNKNFLVYALQEINVIILNLISIKSQILLDTSILFNNMMLSKTNIEENSDPFWDQPAFNEIAAKNKNNYKVPICRKGNRQFASALGPNNLDAAKVLRNILKETLEWYN